MSEQAQESVKKQVVGVCEEISEKNGWTTFCVNVGSQYPIRLQTKLPALIESGRAVGNAQATWHYKESQGNPNPNKPGSFYQNRYFESVEVGDHGSTPSTGVPSRPAEGAHQPVAVGDRDRTITRMACVKAACDLYGGWNEDDLPLTVMKAAQRFEMWVYRDIDPLPSDGGTTPPSEEPMYVPDDIDDIPFGDGPGA
jgi:hypothetical protein